MTSQAAIIISSTINSATILQKAENLAQKLNLPFEPDFSGTTAKYFLLYTERGLSLVRKNTRNRPQVLLHIDFLGGKNGYRFAHNRTINQPLAKAAGIKSGFRPSVLDATAGLGADGFVLASLGCPVTMCERSPIVSALLADALSRAGGLLVGQRLIADSLHLLNEDAKALLTKKHNQFHIIYLDPMYPKNTESSLNRQEMRIIRELAGDDDDSGELLEAAFAAAQNRVVVKRPAGASLLSARKPHHAIHMKNSRFDVYLTFHG